MKEGQNAQLMDEEEPAPKQLPGSVNAQPLARQDPLPGASRIRQGAEPSAPTPDRKEKQSGLAPLKSTGASAGESLIGMGRSLRILAITVIILLSAGLGVMVYGQLRQNSSVADAFEGPRNLLSGFALLMLLTVGYLVGKHWTTTRHQRRIISRIMEEEAIARALHLNPLTQYHHPEVCRDILLQQASHAARLHAPLSLLELGISDLGKLGLDPDTRPLTEELIRKIRRLCRATDSLLRWTPDSFLLVFPEVTREELLTVSHRIRQELERWLQDRFEAANQPTLRYRGITSKSLDASGDILLETQRLLENETGAPNPLLDAVRPQARREKGIGLALELEVWGLDQKGNRFEEKVTTERVASDRIWFVLKVDLPEQSPLTIVGPDGSFQEDAVIARWIERGGKKLAEVQFAKTPENWVVRC